MQTIMLKIVYSDKNSGRISTVKITTSVSDLPGVWRSTPNNFLTPGVFLKLSS